MHQKYAKRSLAYELGVSRASLYYVSKQMPKDWALKEKIAAVLSEHPSYGFRRVAIALHINKKRTQRVMKLFGMRAYRRRGRKYRKISRAPRVHYENLLATTVPERPHHIWATDFTYLPYKGKFLYLSTVIDLFGREIVGWSISTNHAVPLILQSLFASISSHQRPAIFHSDNGSEYASVVVRRTLMELGVKISRSAPGCPWQNGFQESFYSQFKVDLGDTERFKTLGELVYAVHRTIWEYNNTRIHSALRMPPKLFVNRYQKLLEKVS
ncbi:MAG: IS3 family transposase [bacterium]|nr:IS3 family transposase [bacterium]